MWQDMKYIILLTFILPSDELNETGRRKKNINWICIRKQEQLPLLSVHQFAWFTLCFPYFFFFVLFCFCCWKDVSLTDKFNAFRDLSTSSSGLLLVRRTSLVQSQYIWDFYFYFVCSKLNKLYHAFLTHSSERLMFYLRKTTKNSKNSIKEKKQE